MQVNLAANLAGRAGETNAKSLDVAEGGADNCFLSQMGQILKRDTENNDSRGGGSPFASGFLPDP